MMASVAATASSSARRPNVWPCSLALWSTGGSVRGASSPRSARNPLSEASASPTPRTTPDPLGTRSLPPGTTSWLGCRPASSLCPRPVDGALFWSMSFQERAGDVLMSLCSHQIASSCSSSSAAGCVLDISTKSRRMQRTSRTITPRVMAFQLIPFSSIRTVPAFASRRTASVSSAQTAFQRRYETLMASTAPSTCGVGLAEPMPPCHRWSVQQRRSSEMSRSQQSGELRALAFPSS